jgi:hypothetical protein
MKTKMLLITLDSKYQFLKFKYLRSQVKAHIFNVENYQKLSKLYISRLRVKLKLHTFNKLPQKYVISSLKKHV